MEPPGMRPTWYTAAGRFLLSPEANAASECVAVLAQSRAWRRLSNQLRVSAAEHDLVSDERRAQPLRDIGDVASPSLLPEPLEPRLADVLFVGPSFLIRQVREFQCRD